ncbi:MAG: TerC family protein, partial [Chloroflexota bacterium]
MTGIVSVPWYFYAGFLAFVVTMLLVDLRFFRVDEDGSTARRSAMWMGAWVGLAIVFGAILFVWRGPASAAEYFAGYVIEYSLSVDNMFIFLVIFSTFGIPVGKQHRVLFLGILGALFFRSVVIGIGAILVHTFRWVIYLFGGLLLYTAYKIFRKGAKQINPEDN